MIGETETKVNTKIMSGNNMINYDVCVVYTSLDVSPSHAHSSLICTHSLINICVSIL